MNDKGEGQGARREEKGGRKKRERDELGTKS